MKHRSSPVVDPQGRTEAAPVLVFREGRGSDVAAEVAWQKKGREQKRLELLKMVTYSGFSHKKWWIFP